MEENKPMQTPIEDLRNDALKHYEEASTSVHNWSSSIPKSINFYFDYIQMSWLQKIKQAFKN